MNAPRVIVFGFMLASISPAQNILSGTSEPAGNGRKLVATFDGPPRSLAAVVTGAPYSAEQVRTRTQTLSDGSHIREALPSRLMFRDSQGRRRMESWIMAGPDGEPGIHVIEIRDFVTGYEYTLDTEKQVAHRVRIPVDSRAPNTLVVSMDTPLPTLGILRIRPQSITQSLGTQTIEGSLADGTKVTTTIPIGFRGNNRALVSTKETWVAQDLKMVVLSKQNDPKDGETVTRLINIRREEPDPGLFQVPPTYRIVDEESRFTIETTRPRENDNREDELSIRDLLAGFAKARNAFDAKTMAAAYAEDGEFVSLNGPVSTGPVAIERLWSDFFTQREGVMERTLKGVRLMRPDLAVAEGAVRYTGPRGTMDFVEHYVLRKDAGRWQILFHRYVDSK